ncbi:MAG: FAD-dependent oxidoreductase [Phycisphaerales bacterium]|nr:FAD-dependent oxidoreductase [Phycisphaerales bacterium]
MLTRRQILGSGLCAIAYGLASRIAVARTFAVVSRYPTCATTNPIEDLCSPLSSTLVDGLPFAPRFTGDDFENSSIPFHATYQGPIPEPTEEVDVAVIGGGLAGLCCAYLLRRHDLVLFDLRGRFGGNAMGERWGPTPYSIGSAYVITPDRGSILWRLYHELGVHRERRESFPPDPMELGGVIREDYWSGGGMNEAERTAFRQYAEVVCFMADQGYPEIPLPADSEAAAYVRELDSRSFHADLTLRMGMPLPPLLRAGVQSYFYSSFGADMEEISAAAGWNFVAAEEYGRWVFPGGNAGLARALWRGLAREPYGRRCVLRAGCPVVDVRKSGQRVHVTWIEGSGLARSLRARFVVMANSKHIAKHMLPDLPAQDPAKREAMNQIETMAYLVANVLLDAPIERDFYDCFLIGDESFPADPVQFQANPRPVDMLRGDYARINAGGRSVLTLYWPLPWHQARFTLITPEAWKRYAEILAPRVRQMLGLLDVPESAVRQVRLTRWGHAMPLARPGMIADGVADELRRPFLDRIYFANQDNWALPAVENSLLDAHAVATEIADRLR